MLLLGQKNILITGASSGIGKATALAAAVETTGKLFLCGRDAKRLQEVDSACRSLTSQSKIVQFIGDFFDNTSLDQLCRFVKESGETLDCIIFCAGVDKAVPFKMANQKLFEDLFRINTVVPFELSRLLLKSGLINQGASILFLSSVMGQFGQPGQVAYCASKSALISASKALALELSGMGIRVNVIAPGIVLTALTEKLFASMSTDGVESIRKMHPLGLGDPEDVANLAIFLFSDKAKWITGSTINVDGGYSAH